MPYSDYDDPGTFYGHPYSSPPVLFVIQASVVYLHVEQHRVSNEIGVTIQDETAFYVLGEGITRERRGYLFRCTSRDEVMKILYPLSCIHRRRRFFASTRRHIIPPFVKMQASRTLFLDSTFHVRNASCGAMSAKSRVLEGLHHIRRVVIGECNGGDLYLMLRMVHDACEEKGGTKVGRGWVKHPS
ncbi:hypothetical protein EDD15DRAFT_1745387 [Pisolithus albus]|nr:hypothetical protein EDD15DRAFT_1745387 [Pisolithus albus]